MMTFQLWLALRYPPKQHPLYQRVVLRKLDVLSPLAWGTFILFAPILLLPAFILIGFTYGLIWSISISRTIAKERASGSYDLVSLTSNGEIGQIWVLATASIHHNESFERITNPALTFGRLLFAMYLIGELGKNYVFAVYTVEYIVFVVIFTVAFILIDDRQSIVLGVLAGMLAPTLSGDRVNTAGLAFAVFASVQMLLYLIGILTIYLLLPELYETISINEARIFYAVVSFLLLICFGLREGAIYGLWRLLLRRLNTDPQEIRSILSSQA